MVTINNITGFETKGNEEARGTQGTPAFNTSIARSGGACLELPTNADDSWTLRWDEDPVSGNPQHAGTDNIMGFAFRFNGNFSEVSTIIQMRDTGITGLLWRIDADTSNQLLFIDNAGTTLDTSFALSIDTWYYIEVYWAQGTSANWEWFIDGVSEGSGSTGDFDIAGIQVPGNFRFQAWGNGPTLQFYDDVYCLSGATSSADRLGGVTHDTCPRVVMFQNDQGATAVPDASGDGTGAGQNLTANQWNDTAQTPLSTAQSAQYDADNDDGSVDLVGPGRKFLGPYHFDTSDAGPQDDQAVWTNDANAFDGDEATFATTTTTGSATNNDLRGEGTNAPASGGGITTVYARLTGSFNSGSSITQVVSAQVFEDGGSTSLGTRTIGWTSTQGDGVYDSGWGALSAHSGGWTWAKIQALEVALFVEGTGSPTWEAAIVELIVESDDGDKTLSSFTINSERSANLQEGVPNKSNIASLKGIWHAERDNGSSTTFTNYLGNDGGVAADMVSNNPALGASPDNHYLITNDTNAFPDPVAGENLRQGFGKLTGGRDYHCYEMWTMLLFCPNHPDGDLALLSDAEFPDQNYFVGPFEA